MTPLGGKRRRRSRQCLCGRSAWRAYTREELLSRDKASLDVFWLKDSSMTDLDSLPEPDILLEEILENLGAAMENFAAVRQAS